MYNGPIKYKCLPQEDSSMKYILVIGDGMADNPVPELGGKTPLEAAEKPFIDSLAKRGKLGSVLTVPRNQPPGSDTAIMSIFGCDPNKYYTGRSPLEAAGTGVAVKPGSVSYRCNMVCLEDGNMPFESKRILSHNAGSIDGQESIEIVEALFADERFKAEAERLGLKVWPAASFRHIVTQKNGDANGIKLQPPHDILGKVIGDYKFSGNENADQLWNLMKLANQVLDHHPLNESRRQRGLMPANCVWFWAEGTAVQLPSFVDKYGKYGGVVSAVPLCHGIAVLTGLYPISVEGATGETETNCEGKVQAAFDALMSGDDFVAVHLEGPDEATHNGNLEEKLLCIKYLDSRIVEPLCRKLESAGVDFRMLILSDHKTLMSTRGHDGDPVPYLVYDSTKDTGCGLSYTEKNGETGELIQPGTKIMDQLFDI